MTNLYNQDDLNIQTIKHELDRFRQFQTDSIADKLITAFDRLGIEHIFRPRIEIDGEGYNTQFYLPDSKLIVDILPERLTDAEMRDACDWLIELAAATNRDVIAFDKTGKFCMVDLADHNERMKNEDPHYSGKLHVSTDARIGFCGECHEWFAYTDCGSWACKSCGFYDGNATFSQVIRGDENFFEVEVK